MVAELVKNDEPTVLDRVNPKITQEGAVIQLALRSEWQNDTTPMLTLVPNPVPEGYMLKPEWKVVQNKAGQNIDILLLTAVPPPPVVLKPSAAGQDRNAMNDTQLRIWCAENDVSLLGDEPRDPKKCWSRTRILEAIKKAGK